MRRVVSSLAACVMGLGCSAAPNPAPVPHVAPLPTTTSTPAPSRAPEWFLSVASMWVEAADGGLHRAVVGTRLETRGLRIVAEADKPDPIQGGHVAPPWITGANLPCKYVFWNDRKVWASNNWLGEAQQIATLPTNVTASFDWFEGAGVMTAAGLFVVNSTNCTMTKLDVPNAAAVYASSATQAVVLTALGHTRLTADAGKTYRDITREIPNAGRLERVRDELHISTGTDEGFVVNAQGAISREKYVLDRKRYEPEPDPDDRWPADHGSTTALEAVASTGLVLPSGDAIAADDGLVARVDLATGRATEIMRFEGENETCRPLAVRDRVLLVCESGRLASVIDAGSGHVERTFDIEQEAVWDRFVVDDGEALGFVGPCGGRNPGPPVDVVTNASATNTSTQRSSTFCVRTNAGTWVEHQLDPTDAADIWAWVPNADGGATAIVAVSGTFLHKTNPVDVRGTLRVVRLARNAPPIDISGYSSESPKLVSRALHMRPDGSIEGWLSSGHSSSGQMSVYIDPAGRAQQRPLPARASTMMTSGRFALGHTDDGRYFESTDYGRSFQTIDPPPGHEGDPLAVSEAGARVGPFVRIGWGPTAKPLAPPKTTTAETFSLQVDRLPPAVRLGCRFSGPPVTGRMSDTTGLGLVKQTSSQLSPGRIPFVGAFFVPWRGLPNVLTGNADFVYMPLFDLGTPLIRTSVPLSKIENQERISHEMRLGFVLDGTNVWPVAAERFSRCTAVLSDEAGLTIPLGGTCVEEPTAGIAINGRLFLTHADISPFFQGRHSSFVISAGDFKVDRSGKTKPRGSNIETLATHHTSGFIHRFKFAMGQRGKTPVLVTVDSDGNATLTTVDSVRGTIGEEEPLVSLSKLQPGMTPGCADAPDDARVLLVFSNEIGLDGRNLP
ncbi:MAG TPA: hypothetical protein PK156_18645, partial [Polyangium sp.]|nr:hypothetical protein [Polyangium sp.]